MRSQEMRNKVRILQAITFLLSKVHVNKGDI